MESVFYANVFFIYKVILYIHSTGAPTSTPLSLPQTWIWIKHVLHSETQTWVLIFPFFDKCQSVTIEVLYDIPRVVVGTPCQLSPLAFLWPFGGNAFRGKGMFSNGTLGSHALCISDSMLCFLCNLCRCFKLFNAFCHVGFFGDKMSNKFCRNMRENLVQFILEGDAQARQFENLRWDCSHLSWRSWTFLTGLTKIYPYCRNNYICLGLAFLPHKIQKTVKKVYVFSVPLAESGLEFQCQLRAVNTHITKIWLL